MNDSSSDLLVVKLKCTGLRFINGISSKYDDTFDPMLEGVLTESELEDIVKRLNDSIAEYWPCNTCYLFGFVCTPFTLGTSLLCPNYCISQAEEHANRMLENVSLKSRYLDRRISFKIVKECCSSYVAISFPADLKSIHEAADVANESGIAVTNVNQQPGGSSSSIAFPAFVTASGVRLKDN